MATSPSNSPSDSKPDSPTNIPSDSAPTEAATTEAATTGVAPQSQPGNAAATSPNTPRIPEGFIIPDFGDHNQANGGFVHPQAASAGAAPAYTGPRKLAFICSKGNLDMAYPALIMGNAALGEGCEVHIFFTFWGLDIINTKLNDKLKFTFAGNTAMHMPDLARVRPGMEYLSIPQGLGNIPGMTGMATKMMKKQMDDLEIPSVPEMLDILHAGGAHFWACKMTYDMMKIIEADLHPGVEGVISATDFIEISAGAQIIFV